MKGFSNRRRAPCDKDARRYGQDLTAEAAKMDPVIGRDEEIRRVIQARLPCVAQQKQPTPSADRLTFWTDFFLQYFVVIPPPR